ncbi:DUF2169 family type VI secretion system accessory protein [Marinomonas ostreistagni]|uniref:DUF2169 domain-containing protein n=1 Tax=Marinomonas ostreistagni TaxID=359209 RepID=A0ABS0Z7Z4_9GAMM|nr:DUF2169 domain-containing protein [Marinomonas ostreistagni]MBJ7549782.1 DUF2169 domain-containing protein [Marinomonas ostreistagni]
MELNNFTNLNARYVGSTLKDGREVIVLVAKGTWSIPKNGSMPLPIYENPAEIYVADSTFGDPSTTPTLYENDLAPVKPKCDVVMHAFAYSPDEQGVLDREVTLKVGDQIHKTIRVLGPRYWKATLLGVEPDKAQAFRKQEIRYDLAYGGVDSTDFDTKGKVYECESNPIGIGYAPKTPLPKLVGTPAPQLEAADQPIKSPDKKHYRPMAFGPIARRSQPRLSFGGTYDQNWLDNVSPFLPADFDEQYYQFAPQDQQMNYLQGGEEVTLVGVTSDQLRQFQLPTTQLYMAVIKSGGQEEILDCHADTLFLEPELERFSITWRAYVPIEYYPGEIDKLIVGHPTPGWRRARAKGKEYRPLKRPKAV